MAKFTDEHVQKVIGGTTEFSKIDFPGRPAVTVAVRALSDKEVGGAKIDAQVRLREIAKQRGWQADVVSIVDLDPGFYDRLVSHEVIWRAYYDAETVDVEGRKPERFFPTSGHVETLDGNATTALIEAYAEHQSMVRPLMAADATRVEEVIEALKKGQLAEASFSTLDRPTLLHCVTSLARLLRSRSPTNKSSSSS